MTIKNKYGQIYTTEKLEFKHGVHGIYVTVNGFPVLVEDIKEIKDES